MKVKLKNLVTVTTGYQVRKKLSSEKGGTHQLIQMRNISEKNGELLIDSEFSLVSPTEKQLSKFEVQLGDIIIQTKGRVNWATTVEFNAQRFVVSSQFSVLRTKTDVCLPEYLRWYLNRPETQSYFKRVQCGTSIRMLTNENIGRYEVVLPDLSVQEKIIKFNRLAETELNLLERLKNKRRELALGSCQAILDRVNKFSKVGDE